jgi:hypothetical protein
MSACRLAVGAFQTFQHQRADMQLRKCLFDVRAKTIPTS